MNKDRKNRRGDQERIREEGQKFLRGSTGREREQEIGEENYNQAQKNG